MTTLEQRIDDLKRQLIASAEREVFMRETISHLLATNERLISKSQYSSSKWSSTPIGPIGAASQVRPATLFSKANIPSSTIGSPEPT